jgi:hypothetical protein
LSRLIADKIPGGREADITAPIVIDNFVRQWGGTNGAYALQLLDQMLIKSGAVEDPIRPETKWSESPFVKAFTVRYPNSQAESIDTFRKNYESTTKNLNSVKANMKKGDFAEAEKDFAIAEAEGKLARLQGVNETLQKSQTFIRGITDAKDLSPSDKRQLIDSVYFQMIEATRAANKELNDANKLLRKK